VPLKSVTLPQENGKDVFEISSKNGKIILKGSTGVSIASAFNYYLNEYCHCQITWNGSNLALPKVLPILKTPVKELRFSLQILSQLLYIQLQYVMVGLETLGKGN
jgi:alpha-N-acetylglucosaminidase